MNLMLLLDMAREGGAGRTAFGERASGIGYEALHAAAGRVGQRFRSSGVAAVGYVGVAGPALPIALFGSSWAGVPFVPLNYRLADEPLRDLARRIAPAMLLVDDEIAPIFAGVEHVGTVPASELVDAVPPPDLPGDGETPGEPPTDGEAAAVLLFTSGTTGEPKAAVLRQRHLVSYVVSTVEFMSADEDEAALVCVPPYHIAGIAAIVSSVYAGRRVVQLPAFDADAWIDTVREQQVTHAMVVPTMLDRIVGRLAEREVELPSLRTLSYGGGKTATGTIERALDLLPTTDFVNAYGLTETSSTVALLDADAHRAAHRAASERERRRLASVGRPIPSVEISIRDVDGRPGGAGELGEIWVRGEQVSGEYEGRGSVLDADGWFHTSDEGFVDADGFLFVVGRLDDVIVRGGENISPGEIESVLVDHDDIDDAACVGVPDDEWGEVVVAAVVCRPGSAPSELELAEHVRRRLRSSRVPARIVVVDELEYNETGKLMRRSIRERIRGVLTE